MRVLHEPISGMNLRPVMFMPRKSAETVLPSFTAVEDVQPIPIISMETSMMLMTLAVNYRESASSVRL